MPMEIVLATARLVLRRFTPADVTDLHRLDGDPEVMRFLTNGKPTPLAMIRDGILPGLIAEYSRTPGYGRWAAVERSSGGFVGWFALRQWPDREPGDVELGYRLRRSVWGRGYATEGARALIDQGFSRLGAHRVFAETMAVNLASRRVLEKAGLTWVRTFHLVFDDPVPGTEYGEVEYALTRDDWVRQAGRPADTGR
jgi:RimJ/RimL family protein N-acetyltransferase